MKKSKEIGAVLRKRREEKGLTQQELAEAAGYQGQTSNQIISLIERGRYAVPVKKEAAYMKALGCTKEDVLLEAAGMEDGRQSAEKKKVKKEKASEGALKQCKYAKRCEEEFAVPLIRLIEQSMQWEYVCGTRGDGSVAAPLTRADRLIFEDEICGLHKIDVKDLRKVETTVMMCVQAAVEGIERRGADERKGA